MSNLLNGIPVQTTLVPVTSSNIAAIGSHFGKHIRGKFEGKKLEPEETQ